MKKFIGIDIGGTKCAVILGEFQNDIKISDKLKFATNNERGCEKVIAEIIKNIKNILEKNNLKTTDIEAIGISCGGPLDSRDKIILSPPNLIGWDNVEIGKILENEFHIPIKLQNDANACALAEWKFGAGKNLENIIFLTFGTGLGAGLILNGKLYSGTNDMAGEVGHIRLSTNGPVGYGKSGAFEGFCSGGGIAQLGKTRILEKFQQGKTVTFCKNINMLDKITAKDIAEAAYSGDNFAKEIYRECGQYLGMGLSILIDILNPQVIIIGGIFSRCQDLLIEETNKIIEKEALVLSSKVCRVVPAKLGEEIGDYAAIAVAMD